MDFDALLLLSFGGPEGPDDVMPFLRNVTRGRGIPDERLAEVAEHYAHFRGVSPINEQNRALIAALRSEFAQHGIDLPIYWGNRNWKPYVSDAVRHMRDDGVRHALVFATSATGSYSACRQYRDDLAQARRVAGEGSPDLVKLRHFYDHPGFIAAHADGARAALETLPAGLRDRARLVFTAHSIPVSMNDLSGPDANGLYLTQQRETARLVAEDVRGAGAEFDMVWQSRSGPPQVPWLEPDINDHLKDLAAQRVPAVVVSPTGFVSDHLEVRWDLDIEARSTAAELGLGYARAATPGAHPAFVAAIRELVEERLSGAPARALGPLGPTGVDCPVGCCPAPRRGAPVVS
ncbi:MAG: protoporphyrin/coproporphyrin ferrochelatase [Pseudonocardiales bacterium]|jgi:ferrochelatase|nr:protoporphyrin/coproporphyrin ferrochelatase [Pseudonocardiales bacterium]